MCLSNAATGALLSRSLTPDDDVFQHLAHTYASRNPNMTKGDQCKNKMNFPNGVTNGYSWYPLQGEFFFIPSILLIIFTQGHQLVCVSRSSLHQLIPQKAVVVRDAQTCPSLPIASFIHSGIYSISACSKPELCQER